MTDAKLKVYDQKRDSTDFSEVNVRRLTKAYERKEDNTETETKANKFKIGGKLSDNKSEQDQQFSNKL